MPDDVEREDDALARRKKQRALGKRAKKKRRHTLSRLYEDEDWSTPRAHQIGNSAPQGKQQLQSGGSFIVDKFNIDDVVA